MSKVSELAEAEAQRAEAEPDEGELDETEQAEPEPEPEPEPVAQADIDKASQAIARENSRHAKRVEEIMGPEFALCFPCPACDGAPAGFVWTAPEQPPEYATDETVEVCETCRGLGQLLTGSRVHAQALKPCGACLGSGWRNRMAPVPQYGQPPMGAPQAWQNGPPPVPTYPPNPS